MAANPSNGSFDIEDFLIFFVIVIRRHCNEFK